MPVFEFPQDDGSKIQVEGDTPEEAEGLIPEIKQHLASQSSTTTVEKTTPGTEAKPPEPKSALGQITDSIKAQLPNTGTGFRIAAQGALNGPLGDMVDDTDESKAYTAQHPYISGALNTLGGGLALGGSMVAAPEVLGALGASKLASGANAVRGAIGSGIGKLTTGLGIGAGAYGLSDILDAIKNIHSHHSE